MCTIRRADGFTTEIRRVWFGGFEGEGKGDGDATPIWHYGEIVPVACINVVTWLHRAIDAGCPTFHNDFWVMFESFDASCSVHSTSCLQKIIYFFLEPRASLAPPPSGVACARLCICVRPARGWVATTSPFVITAFRPHSLTYSISIFSRWSFVA